MEALLVVLVAWLVITATIGVAVRAVVRRRERRARRMRDRVHR